MADPKDRGPARTAVRKAIGRLLAPVLELCRQPGWLALERVADVERSVAPARVAAVQWQAERGEFRAGEIKLEMLRSEVRALDKVVSELGQTVWPDDGSPRVTEALPLLEMRVADCERRLQSLEVAATSGADGARATVAARYRELLGDHHPVLVLGRGGEELLATLDHAAECTDATGGLQYLRSAAPGTLGAVVLFGGLEQLALDSLAEMLELIASGLRPGGLFVSIEPTATPGERADRHSKLITSRCEAAGFAKVEMRVFPPATGPAFPFLADAETEPWVGQVNRALHRLNDVLFGPEEYAIVATAGTAPVSGHDR